MALELTVLVLLLTWSRFLRRFEKVFIGENEVIALVAVDILRPSMVVSIISWAHRASVQLW